MMKKGNHSLLLSENIQILNALINTDATLCLLLIMSFIVFIYY